MPRPKGSKNAVRTKKANIDYEVGQCSHMADLANCVMTISLVRKKCCI